MLLGKGNPIKRIHSDSVQPVPITRTSLPLSGGCGSKGQFSGERAPPSGRSPALTRKERLKGELDAAWRMPRAMPGALRPSPRSEMLCFDGRVAPGGRGPAGVLSPRRAFHGNVPVQPSDPAGPSSTRMYHLERGLSQGVVPGPAAWHRPETCEQCRLPRPVLDHGRRNAWVRPPGMLMHAEV